MKLEIIEEQPLSLSRPHPLLFISGLGQTAWLWQDTFMPFFAKHGYACYAMNLRGHGKSEGKERINYWTMKDYVLDFKQVVEQLEKPPIAIGHSMGGTIVQMYLKTHQLPAAILLATNPPFGILPFFLRYTRQNFSSALKVIFTQSTWPAMDTIKKTRDLLFLKETSDESIKEFWSHLQDDSFIAFFEMAFKKLTVPRLVKTPILILGGDKDNIYPVNEIEVTARAYNTTAKIFPNMPHNLHCPPNDWHKVADYILEWLNEKNL